MAAFIDIMFSMFYMYMCVCVHVGHPIPPDTLHLPAPPPELQGAQIIKNAIKLESIKIIQFCLKFEICKDFPTHGRVHGLVGGWVDGWVNG